MKNVRIVKELTRLAQQNGGLLLPEKVIEAAKPKNSVLHNRFEWSDSVAGHQFRLWQARQLINVSVQVIEGVREPVQVFVSLRPDRGDGGGYRTVVSVCSDAERREQLLEDALADLNAFQRKYAALRELVQVFAAFAKVRKKAA